MNNFMKLFVIFAVFSQIQSALSQQNPKPSLIQQLCKRNRYQTLCISTLNLDPRSKSSDLQGLASISIDATKKKMNETSNYFSIAIRNVTSRAEFEMYGSCIMYYGTAIDRFIPEVLTDVKAKKYAQAVSTINEEIVKAPNVCDSQFPQPVLPVRTRNKDVREIAQMTIDIIKTFFTK